MAQITIITPEPYLDPVSKAIAGINFDLSFLSLPSPQYNHGEGYVEAVIEYEFHGVILKIEITKFLGEATGYSVISKSSNGNFSKIEYYVDDLARTVTNYKNTFEHYYLKTLSKYE